jgi:hypothetical protein
MQNGAISRDSLSGTYRVNFDKMTEAMNSSAAEIITIQGNGDYDKAKLMIDELGIIKPELQSDLDRIAQSKIPIDIVFKQGLQVLGL